MNCCCFCGKENKKPGVRKRLVEQVKREFLETKFLEISLYQGNNVSESEGVCRSYLSACDSGQGGVICHRFERLVLDCSVEDQKTVRLRLMDILQTILIINQESQ